MISLENVQQINYYANQEVLNGYNVKLTCSTSQKLEIIKSNCNVYFMESNDVNWIVISDTNISIEKTIKTTDRITFELIISNYLFKYNIEYQYKVEYISDHSDVLTIAPNIKKLFIKKANGKQIQLSTYKEQSLGMHWRASIMLNTSNSYYASKYNHIFNKSTTNPNIGMIIIKLWIKMSNIQIPMDIINFIIIYYHIETDIDWIIFELPSLYIPTLFVIRNPKTKHEIHQGVRNMKIFIGDEYNHKWYGFKTENDDDLFVTLKHGGYQLFNIYGISKQMIKRNSFKYIKLEFITNHGNNKPHSCRFKVAEFRLFGLPV